MPEEEPKIIIDEGWKAQVEREREEAQAVEAPETPEEGQSDAASPAGEREEATKFEELISGLAAQSMLALGLIAQPGQDEVTVDLNYAKQSIDMLLMLRDKTKGNVTPREEGMLRESLSELQRAYAMRAQQVQEAALKGAQAPPDLRNPR